MSRVPYFANSVDDIKDEITEHGIADFKVNPVWFIPNDKPNVWATITLSTGKIYLVRGTYDTIGNTFIAPTPSLASTSSSTFADEKIPYVKLKWEHMDRILEDNDDFLPCRVAGYCDSEILTKGQIPSDYFDSFWAALAEFSQSENIEYSWHLKQVETSTDTKAAYIREWSTPMARLRFYILDDGFAIAFGGPTTFLLVGCVNSHPFVYAPIFTFCNSDGYTDVDNRLFPNLTLEEVIAQLRERTLEFIFDQSH